MLSYTDIYISLHEFFVVNKQNVKLSSIKFDIHVRSQPHILNSIEYTKRAM